MGAEGTQPRDPTGRLARLGRGETVAEICLADGIDWAAFEDWWQAETERRVAADAGAGIELPTGVEIQRDERGVPRIIASDDHSLFFAFGVAQAQDRLFQMDLRRRLGLGRVAALIGPDGLEDDRLARTVGLHLAAAAEAERLDPVTRARLDAFADGVNAVIDARRHAWPIEYGLLDAAPQPWSALDSVACATSWRWQLTGRLHVIAAPEVLKRELRDDRLWAAVLAALREADDESIVPAQSAGAAAGRAAGHAPRQVAPRQGAAHAAYSVGAAEGTGSNNWVVSGARTASGKPILAGDPHMPYEHVSAFYEAGLHGGSFDAMGAGFVGVPAFVYGRNARLAWSITNNVCSLRDLYEETVDPADSDNVSYDGAWERLASRQETIEIAGRSPDTITETIEETIHVCSSRHGPIVNGLLPAAAAGTRPIALRWQGSEPCDWIAAQLRLMGAGSVSCAREAVRGWLVPTFNLLLADVDGHIGYQATGELPIRRQPVRGYRPGSDATYEWAGRIPFDEMPRIDDPVRGWLASANNRPATDDFPFLLSGTWEEGYRARRIGQSIEASGPLATPAMAHIQGDVTALRAQRVVDGLLATLDGDCSREAVGALELLRGWDGRLRKASAPAAIYEVLLWRWIQAVTAERVEQGRVDLVAPLLMGLAVDLLERDEHGWFRDPNRRHALLSGTFDATLRELAERCGPDIAGWSWGAIHRLALPHRLAGRGDLGSLLGRPNWPMPGDSSTVANHGFAPPSRNGRDSGPIPDWYATSGAGYRMVADLGDPTAGLSVVTLEGQSGEVGSPHRDDQTRTFIEGRLVHMPLNPRSTPDA